MRRFSAIFLVINLLLAAAVGGLGYLANAHPLRPGDPLFRVQLVAEQAQLRLPGRAACDNDHACRQPLPAKEG